MLCGCGPTTSAYAPPGAKVAKPHLDRTLNTALSWPAPARVDAIYGARLLIDGGYVSRPELSITRAILRTNPRITAAGALLLAERTVYVAKHAHLAPEFLGATLLQESAYDPEALSSAGAVGIAQFTIDTADDAGVNPFDPFDAIRGAAKLIGSYRDAYAGRYSDPYADALAAYNAGPQAVAHYHGIPPYAETRDYVAVIYERWARIGSYERPSTPPRTSGVTGLTLKARR